MEQQPDDFILTLYNSNIQQDNVVYDILINIQGTKPSKKRKISVQRPGLEDDVFKPTLYHGQCLLCTHE